MNIYAVNKDCLSIQQREISACLPRHSSWMESLLIPVWSTVPDGGRHFRARVYYAAAGNVNGETAGNYIREQEGNDKPEEGIRPQSLRRRQPARTALRNPPPAEPVLSPGGGCCLAVLSGCRHISAAPLYAAAKYSPAAGTAESRLHVLRLSGRKHLFPDPAAGDRPWQPLQGDNISLPPGSHYRAVPQACCLAALKKG